MAHRKWATVSSKGSKRTERLEAEPVPSARQDEKKVLMAACHPFLPDVVLLMWLAGGRQHKLVGIVQSDTRRLRGYGYGGTLDGRKGNYRTRGHEAKLVYLYQLYGLYPDPS